MQIYMVSVAASGLCQAYCATTDYSVADYVSNCSVQYCMETELNNVLRVMLASEFMHAINALTTGAVHVHARILSCQTTIAPTFV